MSNDELPVVVIGAGPVGLAAAAELRERDRGVLVFERGRTAGAAVAQWNHVRLFSRWGELIAPSARRLLDVTGWTAPDEDTYPTGRDWQRMYLAPLAAALGSQIVRTGVDVTGVSRRGRDRIVDAGRDSAPFTVRLRDADGREERVFASAVIDASGTWGAPNPLGGDGLAALGETAAAAAGVVGYRVPDLDDPAVAARHAGRHTVIAGSGHSALTAIVALAGLAEQAPGTRLTWVLRRGEIGATFGGGDADQLPARGALGERARRAVEAGLLEVVTGFRTAAVEPAADGQVALVADSGARVEGVDAVVTLTGFAPDLSWLSQIRLELDSTLQAPVRLAPMIDPNVHSCGTVYPHGVDELSHPEPGFYSAGMKSYGRAPTFLAMTGYEQVRSIAAEIAGDHDAARRVELALPDTGVCGGAGVFDDPAADTAPDTAEAAAGGGCCGAPAAAENPGQAVPELITLTGSGARLS
ncbi:FAD-dependent oxidoreductase [Nocardia higoensis]|uniref:FAD-dependent oxidoreductase n=1 Tax=Nocardia higoensis TaxID=228599 RepID=A0ABS0DET9_9NOCA|nr:FAD-dependent oxidoreductase [Nocardia higoensis]MBF6356660.1 FAD-dependent oxidoreductase [Nocardia higoensis]